MSTHSMIGMETRDGTIVAVHCTYDGHPLANGVILAKHYTSAGKVAALMGLGALEQLGPDIGEKHDPMPARFDVCTAWHRDHGQKWHARRFENAAAFYGATRDLDAEWIYLARWTGVGAAVRWEVGDHTYTARTLRPDVLSVADLAQVLRAAEGRTFASLLSAESV